MRFVLSTLVVLALTTALGADEALDAVNAKRASRGLQPYTLDPGLTAAAQSAAQYRATNLMFGHTANDFQFLPAGTPLVTGGGTAAGCAAYPASYGFMACAVYDNYTYAGAASVLGSDGKMYHHLFVSNTPSTYIAGTPAQPTTVLPVPTLAPQPTVQYTVERRGLFGRRSVMVPTTTGACATAATTTSVNVGVSTTASTCAGGSCNVGSRTNVRVRIR